MEALLLGTKVDVIATIMCCTSSDTETTTDGTRRRLLIDLNVACDVSCRQEQVVGL